MRLKEQFPYCSHGKDIPLSDVQYLLPEYFLYQLMVSPEDIGHTAVARNRTYIYCCHSETGVYLFDVHDMYNRVKRHMAKSGVQTACADYFVSGSLQQTVHLESIARSRKQDEPRQKKLHQQRFDLIGLRDS